MKIKRNLILFYYFFVISVLRISAQPPVDLSLQLSDFTEQAVPGRWVVLSGQVEGYRVLNRDADSYSVELIIINAQWDRDERIVTWKGVVSFTGPSFRGNFPPRIPINPGPEVLTSGTRVLILARHTGWSAQHGGPTFDAVQFRRLTF